MNSEIKTSVDLLTEAGFDIKDRHTEKISFWGTMDPEPFSVGKNHFKSYFRDVFVGECVGGYYVTSNIVGDYRNYRCHRTYPNTNIANIFGSGKTPVDAVVNFLVNFKLKNYNVSR